jgi:nitrite reductase/ring-hydroxylating ferredoxin subunit/uncharacterized membrane protein
MRAKASFKGHAIHQMLIPFPLAFLAGAFLFDIAGVVLDRPALWETAAHLAIAGVAAALVAAVPGLVDLLWSVPPRSSGKARGLKHAAANLSATALFAAAWWLRGDVALPPGTTVLGAEALGTLLLGVGGWMGGTLVARNQIGVDHRYARAGKWTERTIGADAGAGTAVAVARKDELDVDQMMLLHFDGRRIVLARTEEGYAAFDDRCPHSGASLADGVLICGTVQCPWHGSQFDVRSGARRAGPAEEGIRVYAVEVQGDDLRVVLPESDR